MTGCDQAVRIPASAAPAVAIGAGVHFNCRRSHSSVQGSTRICRDISTNSYEVIAGRGFLAQTGDVRFRCIERHHFTTGIQR